MINSRLELEMNERRQTTFQKFSSNLKISNERTNEFKCIQNGNKCFKTKYLKFKSYYRRKYLSIDIYT